MDTKNKQSIMPKFSIKNSCFILLAGITGGIILPYFFHLVHLNEKLAVMLFLPILLSLAIAYGQCFIETNIGIGKRFYCNLIIAFAVLEVAAYFWLFKGVIF